MGEKDYESLSKIYRFATDFCNLADLPFHFKVDSGRRETIIVFNLETGASRQPDPRENYDTLRYPEKDLVPDIADYSHKIIIEYEEETGNKRSGAKLARKGHGHEGDNDGKRDSRRNECYERADFKLLRIWESNFKKSNTWKIVVTEFLIDCWRKSLNDTMMVYSKVRNIE